MTTLKTLSICKVILKKLSRKLEELLPKLLVKNKFYDLVLNTPVAHKQYIIETV